MRIIDDLLPHNDSLSLRDVGEVAMVVLHCTELPTLKDARDAALRKPGTGASGPAEAHYYIDRDGSVSRFVNDDRVARHVAGHNEHSIGIEMVNLGRYPDWFASGQQVPTEEYPEGQILSLLDLLSELRHRLPSLRELRRHSDLDKRLVPARDNPKTMVHRRIDPGPLFPWERVLCAWTGHRGDG